MTSTIIMMVSGTALLYSAVLCLLLGWGDSTGTRPPKKYVVNLDLPDQERWVQVAKDHKWIVKDVHTMFR